MGSLLATISRPRRRDRPVARPGCRRVGNERAVRLARVVADGAFDRRGELVETDPIAHRGDRREDRERKRAPGPDRRRLRCSFQGRRVQERPREERDERGPRAPGPRASAGGRRGPWRRAPGPRSSTRPRLVPATRSCPSPSSELEVDEGCDAGGPEDTMTSRASARTTPSGAGSGGRAATASLDPKPRGTNWSASIPSDRHERRAASRTVGVHPAGDEPAEQRERRLEGLGPEEDPREAHERERHDPPAQDGRQRPVARPLAAGRAAGATRSTASSAPWIAPQNDERPRGAVPQAAEDHRERRGCARSAARRAGSRRAGCRGSRAASEDSVMCQRRQNVLDRASPCTGASKFCGKRKPEQQRDTDRDVGVAAEVRVDLRSRSRRSPKRISRCVCASGFGEDRVDDRRGEEARDHDLLEQAGEDQPERAARRRRRRGSGVSWSCGSSSRARTIGPATRCGKNDR